jgi:hypothetical protein
MLRNIIKFNGFRFVNNNTSLPLLIEKFNKQNIKPILNFNFDYNLNYIDREKLNQVIEKYPNSYLSIKCNESCDKSLVELCENIIDNNSKVILNSDNNRNYNLKINYLIKKYNSDDINIYKYYDNKSLDILKDDIVVRNLTNDYNLGVSVECYDKYDKYNSFIVYFMMNCIYEDKLLISTNKNIKTEIDRIKYNLYCDTNIEYVEEININDNVIIH